MRWASQVAVHAQFEGKNGGRKASMLKIKHRIQCLFHKADLPLAREEQHRTEGTRRCMRSFFRT